MIVDLLLAAVCAGLFAALHLVSARAHTLHHDAADLLYPVVGLLEGVPSLMLNSQTVTWFGRQIPYSFHPYHGPYEGYLSVPFLFAFGHTAWAAYIWSTFFGALTVVGVYAVAKRLHKDRGVAFLAAALWAVSSHFVLFSRWGFNAGTAALPMCLFASWAFLAWLEGARASRLVAASAMLGLACATRAWCFALPLSGAAAAWFAREPIRAAWKRSGGGPRLALLCAVAFGVWHVPLAADNVVRSMPTIRFFLPRGVQASGLRAFDMGAALEERADGLRRVLNGTRWLSLFTEDFINPPAPTAMPLLAGLAGAAALGAGLIRRFQGLDQPRRHLLPLLVFAGYFFLSLFSPTNRVPNHLYPVLPFLYIAVASTPLLLRALWRRRAAWAGVLIFAGFCVAADLRILRWFWTEVERLGGRGPETSLALEDLARWLDESGRTAPFVASASNFGGTLLYLTAGRVIPSGPHWGPEPEAPVDPHRWEAAVQRPGALFLFALDPDRHGAAFKYLSSAAKRQGVRLRRLKTFARRDGKAAFEAYEALRP